MNEGQVVQQIAYVLKNRRWGGADGGELVLGDALESVMPTRQAINRIGLQDPICFVAPGLQTVDPSHNEALDFYHGDFFVRLFCSVPGDEIGRIALIGGARLGGVASSSGRGLLEFQEEILSAVGDLSDIDGFRIDHHASSSPQPEFDESWGYTLFRDYKFSAKVTRDRFYHPVYEFAASDATGGDATLTFTLPPDRFDKNDIVIRRTSGSTAPSSAFDDSNVSTSSVTWDAGTSLTSVSVTDSPGAGTFSYAVFAAYQEAESGNNDRFSASRTATVTVT